MHFLFNQQHPSSVSSACQWWFMLLYSMTGSFPITSSPTQTHTTGWRTAAILIHATITMCSPLWKGVSSDLTFSPRLLTSSSTLWLTILSQNYSPSSWFNLNIPTFSQTSENDKPCTAFNRWVKDGYSFANLSWIR